MKPTSIVIHHELGNQGFWGVNEYHRQIFNFRSSLGYYCAYQYFINKDGQLFQARLDDEEGCHTIGRNKDSIGICLAGNFDLERPTPAQLITLKDLILRKMTEWAIRPNEIYGHRIYANYKSCPGRLWKESELRELFQPNAAYYQKLLNSIGDWLRNIRLTGRLGSKSPCIDKNSR